MPTPEQDKFMAEVFGVDPTRYPPVASSGGAGGAGVADGPAPGGADALKLFQGLSAQWQQAEQHAHGEVQKLKAALDDLYSDDPAAEQMEKDFQVHLDAIFGKFDGELAKELQMAAVAKTGAELVTVKAEFRQQLLEMIAFLEHDSIALMDSNPLVKVDIASVCESTLKSMVAALA